MHILACFCNLPYILYTINSLANSVINIITIPYAHIHNRSNSLDPKAELASACRDGNYERARELIALGVDPRQSRVGFFNWSPLHFACHQGELSFAKMLIETFDCQPEAEDKEGRVALHLAAQNGHVKVARYLIKNRGCTVDYGDVDEQTPLHHACGWLSESTEEKALEMTKFLIRKCHSDPSLRDKEGKGALLHACEKGFLSIVRFFVDECQCDLSLTDYHGNTPLHYAVAFSDNLELVRYIHSQTNIDTSVVNDKGNNILHSAYASTGSQKDQILEFLLGEAKLDPYSTNRQGKTPFEMSLMTESEKLFELTSIQQGSQEHARHDLPPLEGSEITHKEATSKDSCIIL